MEEISTKEIQELIKEINKKYYPERKKEMEDKPPDDWQINIKPGQVWNGYNYIDPPTVNTDHNISKSITSKELNERIQNIEKIIKEQTLSQVISLIKTRIDIISDKIKDAKLSTGFDYPKLLTTKKEFEKLLDLVQGIR